MIKIIIYFIIFSFIYNLWKHLRISSNHSRYSPPNKDINNKFNHKKDDILDAEFEDI